MSTGPRRSLVIMSSAAAIMPPELSLQTPDLIADHISRGTVLDGVGLANKTLPKALTFAISVLGTFNLIGGYRRIPHETIRKLSTSHMLTHYSSSVPV